MPKAHTHLEIEANLLVSGAISYLFGGATVNLKAGEWAVFWGSVPHQLVFLEENTEIFWLTIPLARLLGWELPAGLIQSLLNGAVVKETADLARDVGRFSDWEADLGSGETVHLQIAELEIEARLRRLALHVSAAKSSALHPTSSELGYVEKMAAFMAQNYQNSLKSEDIAAAAQIHPNYAMNLFKREFGLSIGEFLTRTRLSHAQRLLATTDRKVLDIAFDCGFGSASRFHAAFKTHCGQSPADYRKSLRGN